VRISLAQTSGSGANFALFSFLETFYLFWSEVLMKTFLGVFCTLLLLTGGPVFAAASPAKVETADTIKADMKDQMAKLKLQQKDQIAKLRAQQKDQLVKLRVDQKQQVAKLKADQKARWQKFKDQEDADETPVSAKKARN